MMHDLLGTAWSTFSVVIMLLIYLIVCFISAVLGICVVAAPIIGLVVWFKSKLQERGCAVHKTRSEDCPICWRSKE